MPAAVAATATVAITAAAIGTVRRFDHVRGKPFTATLRTCVGSFDGCVTAAMVGANAATSPPAASCSAVTNSAQDWYRSSGRFASTRSKTASIPSGRRGLTAVMHGTGLVRCADITDAIEVPVNGGFPVSRWNAVQPRE